MKKSLDERNLSVKVRLRAMEPEDLDALYMIENDSDIWDVGSTNVPYSRYLLHDYIANASGDIYVDKQVRLIVESEDQELVGLLDIMNFDPSHRRAEIGIVIQRQFRRKGYATAALRQAINYSANSIRLHQLYAYIDAAHKASSRTFQKVGFNSVSILKDWLYDGKQYRDVVLMQFFL